jgi:hypothetical protein
MTQFGARLTLTTAMLKIFVRLLAIVLLVLFAYPLAILLHPWWIVVQPLAVSDLFGHMFDELTDLMRLPERVSSTIRTGQWWWRL